MIFSTVLAISSYQLPPAWMPAMKEKEKALFISEELKKENTYKGRKVIYKAESDIKEAIDIWVNLEYIKHGEGGLFPIAEPYDDLREVDMWVQASWWYEWNFG